MEGETELWEPQWELDHLQLPKSLARKNDDGSINLHECESWDPTCLCSNPSFTIHLSDFGYVRPIYTTSTVFFKYKTTLNLKNFFFLNCGTPCSKIRQFWQDVWKRTCLREAGKQRNGRKWTQYKTKRHALGACSILPVDFIYKNSKIELLKILRWCLQSINPKHKIPFWTWILCSSTVHMSMILGLLQVCLPSTFIIFPKKQRINHHLWFRARILFFFFFHRLLWELGESYWHGLRIIFSTFSTFCAVSSKYAPLKPMIPVSSIDSYTV